MPERRWSDADRELVKFAINDCRHEQGSSGQAAAVLDALTAAGWFRALDVHTEVLGWGGWGGDGGEEDRHGL